MRFIDPHLKRAPKFKNNNNKFKKLYEMRFIDPHLKRAPKFQIQTTIIIN